MIHDALEDSDIKLDEIFKFSLMLDIVKGMSYLHHSAILSHGNLKSSNCVLDTRFVLKICDFGLSSLREQTSEEDNVFKLYTNKLWRAPELLRRSLPPHNGTQKGDVYSFAIICQEIVHRKGVFWLKNNMLDPKEIIEIVQGNTEFRPSLVINPETDDEKQLGADICEKELALLIQKCWNEKEKNRPDFPSLLNMLRKINSDVSRGTLVENLLFRMEQYAVNLEGLVQDRTEDYLREKAHVETLLYTMLPKSIVGQLVMGQIVQAEKFDSVTIYFSDVVGFTSMSAASTSEQVIGFLNDLYTLFDTIIDQHDVYKVETIGDAYMIVSGLPVRNGNNHAAEIARTALNLLAAVLTFKIRHMPEQELKIRIGLHTGQVCAGVVGYKMPRYCLFGDTVLTAAAMESGGEPQMIHVSPATKELLDDFPNFQLTKRGDRDMGDRGVMVTWWLDSETTSNSKPATQEMRKRQTQTK